MTTKDPNNELRRHSFKMICCLGPPPLPIFKIALSFLFVITNNMISYNFLASLIRTYCTMEQSRSHGG